MNLMTPGWLEKVPKTPLPKKGKRRALWHWGKRYFDVGDKIRWTRWIFSDGRIHTGRVTQIRRNGFGRVSYRIRHREIMTEDIAKARGGAWRCVR
jgi:hypothetical protein